MESEIITITGIYEDKLKCMNSLLDHERDTQETFKRFLFYEKDKFHQIVKELAISDRDKRKNETEMNRYRTMHDILHSRCSDLNKRIE